MSAAAGGAARGAALYECAIWHSRRAPLANSFTYRTYLWLVDLDDLPRPAGPLRLLASFPSRDHLGDPRRPIRANVDAFLRGHGVDLRGGRVLMLAHARVLGHVFNPLTLYWCHGPDGRPRCVVAEVHNTYGQRHGYLLTTPEATEEGTGAEYRTGKEFYVSPFFPVDGRYRMRLPEPGERLDLTVHLEREGGRPFTATVRGARRAVTPGALLRLALRHPWSTLAVSAAIRLHGIRLFLRGLPVRPRPGRPRRPGKPLQEKAT